MCIYQKQQKQIEGIQESHNRELEQLKSSQLLSQINNNLIQLSKVPPVGQVKNVATATSSSAMAAAIVAGGSEQEREQQDNADSKVHTTSLGYENENHSGMEGQQLEIEYAQ